MDIPTGAARQPPAGVDCQLAAFPGPLEAGPPGRDEPWSWYFRRRLRGAWRKLAERWRHRRDGTPAAAPPAAGVEAPVLNVGDRVRVRSAEDIRRTLDANGSVKGCAFGAGMYQYCGRELRVARVVHHFFDEARFRMLRARRMVLLEGAHCDGSGLADTRGCDRMCFYFWRTEWLEKVEEQGVLQDDGSAAGRAPSSRPTRLRPTTTPTIPSQLHGSSMTTRGSTAPGTTSAGE